MLRLPASKIELGHRDLSWHKHRFERRKIEHSTLTGHSQLPRKHAKQRLSPTKNPPAHHDHESILLSYEPLARDSDAFWAGVLSNATNPCVEVPQLQAKYDDSKDMSQSSRSRDQSYRTAASDWVTPKDSPEHLETRSLSRDFYPNQGGDQGTVADNTSDEETLIRSRYWPVPSKRCGRTHTAKKNC